MLNVSKILFQLREAIQKKSSIILDIFQVWHYQDQQVKLLFHLGSLTSIDATILNILSDHFYKDPFLITSSPKFENLRRQ